MAAAARDCGFELVDHTPCSPDLAQSDYVLFPNMKKHSWLGNSIGPMMRSYLQLMTFSEDQDESFYTTGIQALQHRWKKCVGQGRHMLKNKPHLVKFDNCITVSLWTFQLTLVSFSLQFFYIFMLDTFRYCNEWIINNIYYVCHEFMFML